MAFLRCSGQHPSLSRLKPWKDAADSPETLEEFYPFSTLKGGANVLVFPDLNSANIAYKLLKKIGGGKTLGPILMGMSKPVHLLWRGADVDEIVNAAAIAVVDAPKVNGEVSTAASLNSAPTDYGSQTFVSSTREGC